MSFFDNSFDKLTLKSEIDLVKLIFSFILLKIYSRELLRLYT